MSYLKREIKIRKTLRKIAKQRVAMVLDPHKVWVIEHALMTNRSNEADIATCIMRGWIEVLSESIPKGSLNPDGSLPDVPLNQLFNETENLYKITDSGWAVINRQNTIITVTLIVAFLTLIIMLFD